MLPRGRFRSNVPLRVIQPATDTTNCTDMTMADNGLLDIKEEEERSKRKRQAALPCVRMLYEVRDGSSQGKLRVTVCWREVLYDDDAAGLWVKANLIF
jgi:hypothetical protein